MVTKQGCGDDFFAVLPYPLVVGIYQCLEFLSFTKKCIAGFGFSEPFQQFRTHGLSLNNQELDGMSVTVNRLNL